MNSRRAFSRTVLLIVATTAIVACGAFAPVPSINSFNGNVSSVPAGQEIYFNVTGSTQGSNFSAFQDYSGTLAITGDGVVAASQSVESDFGFSGLPVTFNETGTVETFATVTASDGSSAFKTVEIQVTSAVDNRGSVTNPVRLTFGASSKESQVGTGSRDSSYYRVVPGATTMTIDISSETNGQDLDVYVFASQSFSNFVLSNTSSGTPNFTLFGLTVNDPYYIRVDNWSNSAISTFGIRVY